MNLSESNRLHRGLHRTSTGGTHRGGGRYDEAKGASALVQPLVTRAREEAPVYVHASGALSDRTDRDGHSRRLHELDGGPGRRVPAAAERGRAATGAARESHITQTHISELPLQVTGSGRSRGASSTHGGVPAAVHGVAALGLGNHSPSRHRR